MEPNHYQKPETEAKSNRGQGIDIAPSHSSSKKYHRDFMGATLPTADGGASAEASISELLNDLGLRLELIGTLMAQTNADVAGLTESVKSCNVELQAILQALGVTE